MLISLQLLRRPDGRALDPTVQQFPGPQVTIGRAPECQLVLPDELRVISRHHARIALQDDTLRLACLSGSAPVRVNGEAVPQGASAPLHGGDVIDIGGFEMRIGVDVEPNRLTRAAPAAPALARRARLDEWFDLEPLADPATPVDIVIDAADGATGEAATDSRIVVAWRKPPRAAPAPSPRRSAGATPSTGASPPRAGAAGAPAVATPPQRDASVGPSVAVSQAFSRDAPATLDDDARLALVRAFAEGAGLDPAPGSSGAPLLAPSLLTPEWMRRIGELLAASVEGTLELLRSRATVKREMRAEMTIIGRRQNNPLKFAPDTAAALAHLVTARRSPGFLEPVAALKDAHQDLLAHQLAVMAGMRAALFELIAHMGPEAVMREQGAPGALAHWFPLLHEAALWRRHRQHHAELTKRLDSDFEALFGREFTKAYEAQARRLREPDDPHGPDEPDGPGRTGRPDERANRA